MKMNNDIIDKKESAKNKIQYGVDLTFAGSRLMDISSALTARYDAGICKHRLERTGVIEFVIGGGEEYSSSICARDYKSFCQQPITAILEVYDFEGNN